MACNGDSCEVVYRKKDKAVSDDDKQLRYMLKGLNGEQLQKLRRWMGMEPMDWDAPGSTVREQGV